MFDEFDTYASGDDPKWSVARASGRWTGQMGTELRSRGFTYATSEPTDQGGRDDAPSPMELLAGAVAGCITVVVETVAAEMKLELRSVAVQCSGTLDSRGFGGTEGVPAGFQKFTVEVGVGCDATDEQFEKLHQAVSRRCPAMDLLDRADVNIHDNWRRI